MNQSPLSPAAALIAHAENIVDSCRVLVVGNAEHGLAQSLVDRGARLVQVLDPDAKRVAHAAAHNGERRVTYAQLTDNSLRSGSYDCALVENLDLSSNPEEVMRGVARLIGTRGVAIFAASNDETTSRLFGVEPGSTSFEALEEMASNNFEEVLLWAQSPFTGYSVVSLDLDQPPEPALDNAYLEHESELADYYVAVCGSADAIAALRLEDMTIVQLPTRAVIERGESMTRQQHRVAQRQLETLQSELEELRSRSGDREVDRLTRELEKRDGWLRELEQRAGNADARADDAEAERDRLQRELDQARKQQASSHEQELTALREKLDEAQRIATRSQKESKWAEQRMANVEDELESALSKLEQLEKDGKKAKDDKKRTARTEAERNELRQLVERQNAQLDELEDLLEDREEKLDDAEERLHELEHELDELEAQVEALAAQQQAAQLRQDDSADVVRLEQQLLERARTMAELQSRLEQLEVYARSLVAEAKSRSSAEPSDRAELSEDPEQRHENERRLAEMAKNLAEREADLVAARWTISELEQKMRAS